MILPSVLLIAQATTATPRPAPTSNPTPTRPALVPTPHTAPTPGGFGIRTVGSSRDDGGQPINTLGSRIKIDKAKASSLFSQDRVPPPQPTPKPDSAAAAKGSGAEDLVAAGERRRTQAESYWRDRETDRRRRLVAAREHQREVCARYAVAAAAATDRDGYTSRSAAALLGALLADCNTATSKADAIEGELEVLNEECRKDRDCQPGWLR